MSSNYEQGLRAALADGLPDRYTLADADPLGQGGFGIVYEGIDHQAHNSVAVKILNAPHRPDIGDGFRREADRVHALDHENIVKIHWTGQVTNVYRHEDGVKADRGVPYFVMEKADGSVQSQMDQGSLDIRTALDYLHQSIQGMAHAHNDRGDKHQPPVVHNDLKPANLLTFSETVKVADFGAADYSQSRILDGEPKPSSTRIQGTPAYMAPERFRGVPPRRASDTYSVGVMAHSMLTDELPFVALENDALAWYKAHNENPIPSLSTAGKLPYESRIIDALQHPIATALAKDPRDRHKSMTDFANSLSPAIALARPSSHPVHIDFGQRNQPQRQPLKPEQPVPVPSRPTPDYKKTPLQPTTPDIPPRPRVPEVPKKTYGRRTFLTFLGVAAASATGYMALSSKERREVVDAEPPIGTASPEQVAVDGTAKDILGLLVDADAKKEAGPIMRELVQLNPDWVVSQAPEMTLSARHEEAFQRRLFLEHPVGAQKELGRMLSENYKWRATQLMATFNAGYTPFNHANDTANEERRTKAHQALPKQVDNTELYTLLQSYKEYGRGTPDEASQDNMRYLLCAALYPDKDFNIDNMHLEPAMHHQGSTSNAKETAERLLDSDLAGVSSLAAALVARRPELSKRIFNTVMNTVLKDPRDFNLDYMYNMSDALAPYDPIIAGEHLHALARAHQDPHSTQAANEIAINLAAFNPEVTARYIKNNISRPETHVAAIALGRSMPDFVREVRAQTTEAIGVWLDVALDPFNKDLTNKALENLEQDEAVLRYHGGAIASGLLASRRFAAAQ